MIFFCVELGLEMGLGGEGEVMEWEEREGLLNFHFIFSTNLGGAG